MEKITSCFIAGFLFCSMGFSQTADPQFKYYEIGQTDEDMLGQSSLVDLDKDGDLDFIVGSNVGTIWWFEYESAEKWTRHTLGDLALTDKGGVAVDIDGDGNIDQVSGGTWFKNTGDPKSEFVKFDNQGIIAYDNLAADLNNDGKPEIVAVSEQDGSFIYFPGNKPEKKWKKVELGEGVPGGLCPNGIGDIDGDGDLDIVRSNLWYDNLDGSGTKWSTHKTIRFVESQGKFANSSRVYVIDMDGDGDMDVVQSESNNPAGRIAWHENKDGKGINWYLHPIDYNTEQDMHSLCVADFDNDGDLDVFSGGGPMTGELYKRCYLWINTEGTGEKWERHEILAKHESFDALAADVDGDGDIDICSKPYKGKTVYFLRNMLVENQK